MSFKVLFCLVVCLAVAQARFPAALQSKWAWLDNASTERVVGGTDAGAQEAKFQISLIRNYYGIIKSHMCGGSLLTPNTVVTAAHCTDGQKTSDLLIRYGTTKRSSSAYPDLNIKEIRQHPEYDPNTINNDISLLVLAKSFTPSDNAAVIAIEESSPAHGEKVTVYGWGLTDGNSQNLPENLQKGEMTIVENSKCNDKWGEVNTITDGMICALDTTRSACNGDSGGPLVSSNGKLTGVVSWGPSKCPPGEYMSVYARPSHYKAWIDANKVE